MAQQNVHLDIANRRMIFPEQYLDTVHEMSELDRQEDQKLVNQEAANTSTSSPAPPSLPPPENEMVAMKHQTDDETLAVEPQVAPRRRPRSRNRKNARRRASVARRDDNKSDDGCEDAADSVDIAMIAAAPFRRAIQEEGAQTFDVSLADIYYFDDIDISDVSEEPPLPAHLQDLADIFSKIKADTLPPHRNIDHHIILEGDPQVMSKTRAYQPTREESVAMRQFLDENLQKGFIVASQSPFASPVLFVKKANGSLRFCVDYRKLNAITKKDRYPLPLIDETIAQLKGKKIFSKLDIRHAFNRIRMQTEEDEELTTFMTPLGQFKSRVLPFGLTNGPATFQHFINEVLWEYLQKFCIAYVDNILIYSDSVEEHHKHVRLVLLKLQEAGLQCDINKCEFDVTGD